LGSTASAALGSNNRWDRILLGYYRNPDKGFGKWDSKYTLPVPTTIKSISVSLFCFPLHGTAKPAESPVGFRVCSLSVSFDLAPHAPVLVTANVARHLGPGPDWTSRWLPSLCPWQ